jgi:hypothetical protein
MALPHFEVWDKFAEFVHHEVKIANGPDCQLKLLVGLGNGRGDTERMWLNGCYAAHHCVPSGYALWREFPNPHVLVAYPDEQNRLEDWLEDNWSALPVRPEMRSHRMVEKRHACIVDFARYAVQETWRVGDYETIWKQSIGAVRYYNRYMAIKYLELMRMTVRPDLVLGDMRAKHGWSPRIGLGLLFPDDADVVGDREDNSDYAIQLTEDCASECLQILREEYNLEISYFQIQVLLCNFREMLVGGFYPRAGHDEEMDYIKLAETKFDMTPVWEKRAELFDKSLLGEHNNWFGIQKSMYTDWKNFGRGIL